MSDTTISVSFKKAIVCRRIRYHFTFVFAIVIDMMQSRTDPISVPGHLPTLYLTKRRIYFLEEVFNNKSEKYQIYEAELNQSQFSISVQGIIRSFDIFPDILDIDILP